MENCRQQNMRNQRGYGRMNCQQNNYLVSNCNQKIKKSQCMMDITDHCPEVVNDPLAGMPLGMAYVPWQRFCNLYEGCEALYHGTLFKDLDLDFYGVRGEQV